MGCGLQIEYRDWAAPGPRSDYRALGAPNGRAGHAGPSLPCLLSGAMLALMLSATGLAHAWEPATNYKLQCMGCHAPDGSGVSDRVPPVGRTLLPFARMPEGRRYLVQVPGVSQSTLTNAELAGLLNWMIENLGKTSAAGEFKRFTEAEVAEYRQHTLVQVRATRERLLARMP